MKRYFIKCLLSSLMLCCAYGTAQATVKYHKFTIINQQMSLDGAGPMLYLKVVARDQFNSKHPLRIKDCNENSEIKLNDVIPVPSSSAFTLCIPFEVNNKNKVAAGASVYFFEDNSGSMKTRNCGFYFKINQQGRAQVSRYRCYGDLDKGKFYYPPGISQQCGSGRPCYIVFVPKPNL